MATLRRLGITPGDLIQIAVLVLAGLGFVVNLKADVKALQDINAQQDESITKADDRMQKISEVLYRIDGKIDEIQRRTHERP